MFISHRPYRFCLRLWTLCWTTRPGHRKMCPSHGRRRRRGAPGLPPNSHRRGATEPQLASLLPWLSGKANKLSSVTVSISLVRRNENGEWNTRWAASIYGLSWLSRRMVGTTKEEKEILVFINWKMDYVYQVLIKEKKIYGWYYCRLQ